MTRGAPRAALGLALLLTLAPAVALPEPGPAAPCPGFRDVPHQGPSCPVPGGWRVFLRDGSELLTHGPDPASLDQAPEVAAPRPPRCVAPSEYHGRVIYAVPSDKANRYATLAGTVRGYVHEANGVLYQEAQEFGFVADYKMRCVGTQLEVVNETLPTPSNADSFSTIVSDLRAKGYTDARAKYWVWYDDGVGGYCGQGSIRSDDRLILENNNNRGNDFGITYGCGSNVMQHENGHNLGAVQLSAPDSSGAWHCNDGRDVMCYADGGSNSTYNPSVCTDRRHFDCHHDSYFHPDPPPGSYLATRWNLGSRLVRFIAWGCAANDTNPPVSSHALAGTQGPVPGYYRSNVTVTLSATDDCSTPTTEYRVDGGAWKAYAAPFVVAGEAPHLVEYRSRDAAGNLEPVRSAAFVIDTTPPVVDNLVPEGCLVAPDPAGAQCGLLPEGLAVGGGAEALLVRTRVTDNFRAHAAHVAARAAALDPPAAPLPPLPGPLPGPPPLPAVLPAPWVAQCSGLVAGEVAACTWLRQDPWERLAPQLRVVGEDAAGNTAVVYLQVAG